MISIPCSPESEFLLSGDYFGNCVRTSLLLYAQLNFLCFVGFLCVEWFAFADSNGGSMAWLCLSHTHLWLVLANGQWTRTINSVIKSCDLSLWESWPKLKHSKRYFISNSTAFFVSGDKIQLWILFCRSHFLKIWISFSGSSNFASSCYGQSYRMFF